MKTEILHHGAVNGVTGSCHELQWQTENANTAGLLIDCGLFQGAETSPDGNSFEQLAIEFPIAHIQAIIITHVHIDHVGRLPYLMAAGFRGPIYCSAPSAKLLPLVLEDAVKIGFTRNRQLITGFLQQLKKQLVPLGYKQWHVVAKQPTVKIKLQPAGHILGSAYVEVDLARQQRIVFSGDLGPPHTPLLAAPRSPYRADTLVIESTYGDRQHESRRLRSKRLQAVIEKAVENRGVVLIPAFSIGRTQELLYELEGIIARHPGDEIWQDIEIIVDSPLAARFTQTYRELKPYWDREARKRVRSGRHPLSFEQLLTIDSHALHQQTVKYLRKTARPAIVLAASGMCAGGRVVNYLKALIEDERTDILFVGYQAEGTPGRNIQRYGPRGGYVELDGRRYDICAGVHTIGGYSAHADQHNLLNFVRRMRHRPQEIRIVHGDEKAKQALKALYQQQWPDSKIVIPA